MWSSIWKWIKRILFIVVMFVSIACSFTMFSDIEGGLNIFLNILTIVLAIGSCLLYFIFNEVNKWPIVLTLISLLGLSIFLAVSSEANIYPICIICGFIGIVISCGTEWIKKAGEFLSGKK